MAVKSGKFSTWSMEMNISFKFEADASEPLDVAYESYSLVDMGSSNEMPTPTALHEPVGNLENFFPQERRRADGRFGVEREDWGQRTSDVHRRAQSQEAFVAALRLRSQFFSSQILAVRVVGDDTKNFGGDGRADGEGQI